MSQQNYSKEPICLKIAPHTFHRLGIMSCKTERNSSKTVDCIEDILGTLFSRRPVGRYQGCGIGQSRQILPESESVKICRLRLRLACVGGSMVYVFGISILQSASPNDYQTNGSDAL